MLTQGLMSNSKIGGYSRRHQWMRSAAGILLILTLASFAAAQVSSSATIRGVVKDPTGAVVTKASVLLINEATKFERKTASNEEGIYTFALVEPGRYTIKVSASGFKTYEEPGVQLNAADTRGMDLIMQVGAASETVTVQASVEQIQKETGAKENTITSKQIENLSIISRSSLELLRILPGVVAPDQNDLESISFGGGANANSGYHVNGLRGEDNNVTVDGSRVMDIGSNNGTVITANPDMVQEVKVQTSNYASEHGSAGVQISATTKNGSQEFHGTAYDYIRNWRFNANDRSNTTVAPQIQRGKSQYDYPGGNIGGPVLIPGTKFNKNRDKLFFFVGFEYYYQRIDDGSFLNVVPTLKQRQGDFSEILAAKNLPGQQFLHQGPFVNVPFGCNAAKDPISGHALNNNLAPCIDPLGKALLNLYPLPNFSNPADPTSRYNYVYSVIRPLDRNQLIARVDYNITQKTRLYVRAAREHQDEFFERGLWWNSSDYQLPTPVVGTDLGRSVSANIVSTLSPTMTNEVLISGSRLLLDHNYQNPDKVTFKGLGLPGLNGFFPQATPYVPINIIDAWGGGIGGNLFSAYPMPLFAHNDSFSVTDNFSKIVKAHSLKAGFTIEQANKTQNFQENNIEITMAQWGQSTGTGNNYGDLLVGRPIQVSLSTVPPTGHFRYYNYEFYAQDSWKVRPNLTLEFGLRLAYMPLNFERNGLAIRFDRSAYDPSQGIFINGDHNHPNGILQASLGQIPKGLTGNPAPRPMPRFNFAWDVNGKGSTVVRGGAGIFYNRVQGNYEYYSLQQPPNSFGASSNTWNGQDGGLTFANMHNVDPFSALAAVNITSRDPSSIEHPRTMNMSLSIARRLPFEQVFEVGYVGTLARHLPQQIAINVVPLGHFLTGKIGNSDLSDPTARMALAGGALRTALPFPAYQNVTYNQFTGTSNYHSLQATLSRQAGRHFQYFATYTFSKALGTTAVNESDGAAFMDPLDTRGRSWGVLPFDRTHIFNLSYNWQIPTLARGALDNKLTRGVFGGWTMSGITTFQSGNPIRLRFSGDMAAGGVGLAWFGSNAFNSIGQSTGAVGPVYVKKPNLSGTGVGDKILDLNSIQIPSFPNAGPAQPPFYIRTPHRSNFDVSLFKDFHITERQRIQFRAGFFNIFNQAFPTRIDVGNPANSDVYLTLNTQCNKRIGDPGEPATVPDGLGNLIKGVCEPTKGYHYTDDTLANFGKITNKRGHRVIEFALKYYF